MKEQATNGGCAYAPDKCAPTVGGANSNSVPPGNHRFELSWAPRESLMRWRHPCECPCELGEKEWRFREAVGHAHVTGCNDTTHRMNLFCQANIIGDVLYLYRPEGMRVPKVPSGTYKPARHWRLCANIHGDNWRLRDENTGELTMVNGYYGSIHLNYLDKGSHVFHIEDGVIDKNGIFHFIDNSLDWQWETPGGEAVAACFGPFPK